MKIPYYHIDAFTDTLFTGNPACVCLLPHWLSSESLQHIAIENNLPVTAFVVREKSAYAIRWITPDYELDLCGHGTLSASYVIFHYLEPTLNQIEFDSKAGRIIVTRDHPWISFSFPAKEIEPITISKQLQDGLGAVPTSVYQHNHERLLIVFENEAIIRNLKPDMTLLKKLDHRGFTVTATSEEVDFVSRTFYPRKTTTTEDAVTGAAHCLLAPYWAKILNKNLLRAKQVSARGGFLECEVKDKNVVIRSQAILYSTGILEL